MRVVDDDGHNHMSVEILLLDVPEDGWRGQTEMGCLPPWMVVLLISTSR